MSYFRNKQNILIKQLHLKFQRYVMQVFPWEDEITGITGSAGTGKSTLLLQYIKQKYAFSDEALYISLDDLYFSDNLFSDLVDDFVNRGGVHVFLDEVHKYPGWVDEIINLHNRHSGLKILFAGSSLLYIPDSGSELKNKAKIFNLPGLSFREYLNYTLKTEFEPVTLEEVLEYHTPLALEISKKIKPVKYFEDYLRYGYYPLYHKNQNFYYQKLQEMMIRVIETDLPLLRGVDPVNTRKIKQLLFITAQSAPFKPNISKLANKAGITRNTLNEYFKYLNEAGLLNMLNKNASGINLLQKPDQVFFENTNLIYAIADRQPDKNNLRKTFFLNQVTINHLATYPEDGDFLLDNKYLFEIGGKNKMKEFGNKNTFIAADDIEVGFENKIPLWLFGFLY